MPITALESMIGLRRVGHLAAARVIFADYI